MSAVRACFPGAELYLCEWHLRHAIDGLLPDVEAAFNGPLF